jgi:hypothetical protein
MVEKYPTRLGGQKKKPHSVTKETPANLFMGRDLRSCLSLVRPSVKDTVMNSQMDTVFQKSRPERSRYFKVGDRVIARDYKGKDHQWIGGQIEYFGNESFRLFTDPLGISSLLNSCDCTRSVNRFIINIVCLNISLCVFSCFNTWFFN